MQLSFSFIRKPTAKEAIKIYTSLGWGKEEEYDFFRFEKAFENSKFITVYDEAELVAFVRFLSDEYHETMVSEFVVATKYQGYNIGKKMLNDLVQEFGHTSIYLNCTKETKDFFLKNGFKKHQLIGLSRSAEIKDL